MEVSIGMNFSKPYAPPEGRTPAREFKVNDPTLRLRFSALLIEATESDSLV